MPFSAARVAIKSSAPSTVSRKSSGWLFNFHFARFDFGKVQNVVDDGQERITAAADNVGIFALFVVELGIHEQAAHADDRVHGRANFMAHGGEERALGVVGLFGFALGALRLVKEPRVLNCNGRLPSKTDGEIEIVLGKDAMLALAAPHRQHADHLVAEFERHERE